MFNADNVEPGQTDGRDWSPYYRVSTKRQGRAGSDLRPSNSTVQDFARYGQHEIIASYQEIETGKRADRPELAEPWPTPNGQRQR